MNACLVFAVTISAYITCFSAWAAEETSVQYGLRMGPSIGTYKLEQSLWGRDGKTNEALPLQSQGRQITFEQSGTSEVYGVQVAPSIRFDRFVGEIAVDLMRYEVEGSEIYRTDVIPTLGYMLTSHLNAFGGYRLGLQSDKLFDGDIMTENGFLIGAGASSIEMGPIMVGASIAYARSQITRGRVRYSSESQKARNFDYDGISVKLSAALASYPEHAVQFRYQRFKGDQSTPLSGDVNGNDSVDRIEARLKETYFQLFYLYSL